MIEAHGLGGGADLPIPADLAIAGGTAALTLSFAVLLMAWREPRFDSGRGLWKVDGRFAGVVDGRVFAVVLRVAGALFFLFALWAALAGPDVLINPVFGIVYVWLWVGLVPASLLFGRFYRAVNPARTIYLVLTRLSGDREGRGLREYPSRLGYWPAVLALFAFVWLELVYPDATYLGSLRLWFALYFVIVVVGALVFGEKWISRADPFEVYSDLVAHLSIWGRTERGELVVMSPLRNLARIAPEPGLVGAVAVLLGSTAYDSYRESTSWIRFVQSTEQNVMLLSTCLLVVAVLVVGVTFTLATMATGTAGGAVSRREIPARMAHSIVPLVVGYMVAHYLTFLFEVGQMTLIQMSDPMGTGANLFGTANWQINYWLSQNPTVLASIKVLAIVTGHVLGVVAAHDRALQLLPRKHQVTGQLPLLAAMVLYTFGGLYLLFGT